MQQGDPPAGNGSWSQIPGGVVLQGPGRRRAGPAAGLLEETAAPVAQAVRGRAHHGAAGHMHGAPGSSPIHRSYSSAGDRRPAWVLLVHALTYIAARMWLRLLLAVRAGAEMLSRRDGLPLKPSHTSHWSWC